MKSIMICLLVAGTALTPVAHAAPGGSNERVRAAGAAATKEPRREDYRGAIQSYAYVEGAIYRLVGAPGHVTEIALEPGEALLAVAAGDTARWTVGDTVSGSGEAQRIHIMIKPLAPGLDTNLIITTDRRVYHLALNSTASTAMAAIRWTYPDDALLAIKRAAASLSQQTVSRGGGSVDVASFNFGYRIRGDRAPWRPLRAFDDGRQTFIEFAPSLAQGEAPPLFVTGEGGKPELVNYRVSGRFYIVDRLFERAELRHGAKRQLVVRIIRTGGDQ
jgi:type IV secretion system protein VirB9